MQLATPTLGYLGYSSHGVQCYTLGNAHDIMYVVLQVSWESRRVGQSQYALGWDRKKWGKIAKR